MKWNIKIITAIVGGLIFLFFIVGHFNDPAIKQARRDKHLVKEPVICNDEVLDGVFVGETGRTFNQVEFSLTDFGVSGKIYKNNKEPFVILKKIHKKYNNEKYLGQPPLNVLKKIVKDSFLPPNPITVYCGNINKVAVIRDYKLALRYAHRFNPQGFYRDHYFWEYIVKLPANFRNISSRQFCIGFKGDKVEELKKMRLFAKCSNSILSEKERSFLKKYAKKLHNKVTPGYWKMICLCNADEKDYILVSMYKWGWDLGWWTGDVTVYNSFSSLLKYYPKTGEIEAIVPFKYENYIPKRFGLLSGGNIYVVMEHDMNGDGIVDYGIPWRIVGKLNGERDYKLLAPLYREGKLSFVNSDVKTECIL
ncbi:MAG: hypothetical protein L6420_09535 [Elusimicrobia bacterium]|nr:hypothetical protein [Elusimicrobiota bacterium]